MIGITRTKDIVMAFEADCRQTGPEWGIATEWLPDAELENATQLVDELRTFSPLAQRTARTSE